MAAEGLLHTTRRAVSTAISCGAGFLRVKRASHVPQLLNYKSYQVRTTLMVQQRFQQTAAFSDALKTTSLVEASDIDPNAPPLPFRWFYATDVPNYMPKQYEYTKTETPKKFKAFSVHDSKRLESAYQHLKRSKEGEELLESKGHKIPVNEDYLFEADLEKKEMGPVYWDGATYGIRRGTWFTDEGNPVSEELATELERGFLRLKPYAKTESEKTKGNSSTEHVYKLEGFKEGKMVVYGQEQVAYIFDELYGGELQLTLMKKVVSGPTPGATRVTRGFKQKVNQSKGSETEFGLSKMFELELSQMFREKISTNSKKSDNDNTKRAMEHEIAEDYNEDNTKQSLPPGQRKVDHLIFCIHGIGQILGTKFQGVNFVHTVNILRSNLKKVYSENKDLQKLLNEDQNCRIQVLPITWRHSVDFQTDKAAIEANKDRKEKLPSLLDITVDEIKPLRNLLGSVLLDVLLYYEPRYLNQILDEVALQANSMYAIFKERNPDFNGKVSIIGHSLGSAIGFDILSLQPETIDPKPKDPKHFSFEVNNFFAIGSPIGVFNLLKRKNVGSRELNPVETADNVSRPRVQNLYNIFHPCDPVGYRIEPLISPEFKEFQPESVPFLIEDFNKQLSSFASFHNNLLENASETWRNWTTTVTSNVAGGTVNLSKLLKVASKDDRAELKELTKKSKEVSKEVSNGDQQIKPNTRILTREQLDKLATLNYNGRVDYALQQGYLDLNIVSSISAHVSYFEDENTAAFILKETLTNHETVKQKKVRILPEFVTTKE